MRHTFWTAWVAFALFGCATASPGWITFPDGKGGKGMTLEDWLKAHPLSAAQELSIQEISRGDSGSSHIVQIRTQEPLHVHPNHDLLVILLKGRGTLTLGSRRLELKPGAVVSIPRGLPHGFENKGSDPAVAYATFFPAFDGADTLPIQEENHAQRAQ